MVQVRYLFAVFVSLITTLLTVSAKTHHVIGGDAEWRVSSSGRVFRVGDKISLTEETIVEVESLEDFTSCNVVNPIRMYTDSDHHITLEKEGIRYFTSANPENCKNGLKLPVHVLPIPLDAPHSFELPQPFWPEPPTEHGPPPFEPWPKPFPPPHVPVTPPPHFPDTPPPYVPLSPPPHFPDTPPPHVPHSQPPPSSPPHFPDTPPPYVPLSPPPHFPDTPPPHVPHSPPPPPPHVPHSPPPPPPHVPHSPPPPVAPSASTHSNGFSFVLFAAMALCYIGQL